MGRMEGKEGGERVSGRVEGKDGREERVSGESGG